MESTGNYTRFIDQLTIADLILWVVAAAIFFGGAFAISLRVSRREHVPLLRLLVGLERNPRLTTGEKGASIAILVLVLSLVFAAAL